MTIISHTGNRGGVPYRVQVLTTASPQDFSLQLGSPRNLVVQWGDGSVSAYTGVTAYKTHSYATAGVYVITFASGTATSICFGNTSCTPLLLTGVLTPIPPTLGLTIATKAFKGCTNCLTWAPHFLDAASKKITTYTSAFEALPAFNEDLGGLQMARATSVNSMLYGDAAFAPATLPWSTPLVADWTYFARNATLFDPSDLGSLSTAAATTLNGAYYNSGANRDVSGWNWANVTNATNLFNGTPFNQTNYDLLLPAIVAGGYKPNVTFHAGTAKYGLGAPATARVTLVAAGWIITDGGPA